MLIELKRQWFDPDGARRRVTDNPHDVPDEWESLLPSSATILVEEVAPKYKTKPKETEVEA